MLIKNLLIVAIVATVISLFTLWFIDSWIKYPLYLFEVSTIIILYIIASGYEIRLTMKSAFEIRFDWGLVINISFIACSTFLLLIALFNMNGGFVQTMLALLCTFLLIGYALLNIFGLGRYFSRLESIVLSYILSYIFTGLIVLVLLYINEDFRTTLILLTYIGLGLASMLNHRRQPIFSMQKSLTRKIDLFALLLSTSFYALSFYFLYPEFALLANSDIVRHHAHSIVLWRTPEFYSVYQYFLAHLSMAAFIGLSVAPLATIQTVLVLLNFMMPLGFYIMSKSYTESIDERLPAVSTIFYSTFSGFAWIYLLKLKLNEAQESTLNLLEEVNEASYYGISELIQPFLWYTPLSVSFMLLMIQLTLLKKPNIREKDFIVIFSLFTIANFMVHVAGSVILSLFLSFYALFSKDKALRIDDALKASIMGFTFLDFFYATLEYVFNKTSGLPLLTILLICTTILIFTYIYRKLIFQAKLNKVLSKLAIRSLVVMVLYLATFIYILGLIVWIVGVPFRAWMVAGIWLVPWFIYPVFFGVMGLLTLTSLYHLWQDPEKRKLLMPLMALIMFSLIFGKMLTFININLFYTGYWEIRLKSYIYLASAVIAPIILVRFFEWIKYRNNIKRTLIATVVVSLVVVYGLQSTFVTLEYWNIIVSNDKIVMKLSSQEEINAINFLTNILKKDKYAYIITLSEYSYHISVFSTPIHRLTGEYKQTYLYAKNPEMTLLFMKSHNLSHAYLYMHKRDYGILNRHSESWLAKHLISMLPIVYRNDEVTIYNVSSVSFPLSNSKTALVIPFDENEELIERWLYANDILSLGEYNYTTIFDLDPKAFSYTTLILPFDPLQESGATRLRNIEDYLEYVKNGGRLIIINANGYGYFAGRTLKHSNVTIKASTISGSKNIELPLEIYVPKLSPKKGDVRIVGYYESQQDSSVYAFREELGSGEILYINLYPIVNVLESAQDKSVFYNILGELLQLTGVQLERFTYIPPPLIATFKEVEMSGNIIAYASSLFFPPNIDFRSVKLIFKNNRSIEISNVTRLQLFNFNKVSVLSSNLTISEGNGFYSNLKFKDNIVITFDGDFILVALTTVDGNTSQLYNDVKTIIINSDQINIYAREPMVTVRGSVLFKELYAFGTAYQKTMSYGQNLKVNGDTTLKMYLSDIYSWISLFDVSGRFERVPPLVVYDELTSLPHAAFWCIVLVPIFITVILITRERKEW